MTVTFNSFLSDSPTFVKLVLHEMESAALVIQITPFYRVISKF